jgi:hypothetical protein
MIKARLFTSFQENYNNDLYIISKKETSTATAKS